MLRVQPQPRRQVSDIVERIDLAMREAVPASDLDDIERVPAALPWGEMHERP
jgi:hypothetical protein